MGKPYLAELAILPKTYGWAATTDVADLVRALEAFADLPLVCLGSGGSLTAAHFASRLHSAATGHLSRAVTPLEAVSLDLDFRKVAVLLLSAQGANPDILGVFKALSAREPRQALAVCAKLQSHLAAAADSTAWAKSFSFGLPGGKDGFLATNTLLATMVLLERAYGTILGSGSSLPKTMGELVHQSDGEGLTESVEERSTPLWSRETLIVLHGPDNQPAAVDLESKFTEAAIGHVQIADYRHFAHGRHHWIAQHLDSTAVLTLETADDKEFARKTLALLPKSVPAMRIETESTGSAACLSAFVQGMHLVQAAGRARGIDPGRPHVPTFGRKIYHLDLMGSLAKKATSLSSREAAAVERKTGSSIRRLEAKGQLAQWRAAYAIFSKELKEKAFAGILLDYDGTLCDGPDREQPPGKAIVKHLARLATGGIAVGIATGRGGSLRDALRTCLPSKVWHRIVIGYRNGAEIGTLAQDEVPSDGEAPGTQLSTILDSLFSENELKSWTRKVRPRHGQITVYPAADKSVIGLWERITQYVAQRGHGVQVLRSSHSVDIIAPGVSKLSVLRRLQDNSGVHDAAILCIGDRGKWPGNDYELLGERCSLSVDEVSSMPQTCWAMASAGKRGATAALELLSAIRIEKGRCRVYLD